MKIHEYQAKELLRACGIPVPRGGVAATPEEARGIAEGLAGPTIVKAQIHAGGRGKGGGVKAAASPEEAFAAARAILGMRLITHQTGPEGKTVRRVLVEEASEIRRELYLSLLVDRSRGKECVLFMASEAGGMEIEQVAATTPGKIVRCAVHPAMGFSPFQARKLAVGLGLEAAQRGPFADLLRDLYRLFLEKDCSLLEINPLAVTRGAGSWRSTRRSPSTTTVSTATRRSATCATLPRRNRWRSWPGTPRSTTSSWRETSAAWSTVRDWR
jgi:succinyl-CoA synthetase beta subunit